MKIQLYLIILNLFLYNNFIFSSIPSDLNTEFSNNLFNALKQGDTEKVEKLIEGKCRCFMDVTNNDRMTPLIFLCSSHNEIPEDIRIKGIKLLLKYKPHLNTVVSSGSSLLFSGTPLIFAASHSEKIVDVLLSEYADTNIREDLRGRTALFEAVLHKKKQIISALIAKGASKNIYDTIEETALDKVYKMKFEQESERQEYINFLKEMGFLESHKILSLEKKFKNDQIDDNFSKNYRHDYWRKETKEYNSTCSCAIQ